MNTIHRNRFSSLLSFTLLIFMLVLGTFFWLGYLTPEKFLWTGDSTNYLAQSKFLIENRTCSPGLISWENWENGSNDFSVNFRYPSPLYSLIIGVVRPGGDWNLYQMVWVSLLSYWAGSLFFLLFLKKYLSGWEFLFIGLVVLLNPYILITTTELGTDSPAWAIFTFLLWMTTWKRPSYLGMGLVCGFSLWIRTAMFLFIPFVPLLFLFHKGTRLWTFSNLRPWGFFYGGTIIGYLLLFLFLKVYILPLSSENTMVAVPSVSTDGEQFEVVQLLKKYTQPKNGAMTLVWYRSYLYYPFINMKWIIPWFTTVAMFTVGPFSPFFGVFFILLPILLLVEWRRMPTQENLQIITPIYGFWIGSFGLYFLAIGTLFAESPTICALMTVQRYFAPFVTLLIFMTWMILRNFFGAKMDRKYLAGLIFVVLLSAAYLDTISNCPQRGYAHLCQIFSHTYPWVGKDEQVFQQKLQEIPPESIVLELNSSAINLFGNSRKFVQIPSTVEDFLNGTRNHELDWIVAFSNWDVYENKSWKKILLSNEIVDRKGVRFVKTFQNVSPNRFYVIFERVPNDTNTP